jgi:FSR family fosmidomycin resistance protein-like MFS transporter
MTAQIKMDAKVIFALTLVHFTGDFYASFISPLLPVFAEEFSLTLAEVGLITGISRFLALVVQPPVGYIADHHRTRKFVLGGPLLAIVFISLVGIAHSFQVLLLFIALGSIGQAMFHPTTAGMISGHAGPRFGLSMSVFNMGGTLAFALGPIFITYLVRIHGLGVTPLTMIFGLAMLMVLLRILPRPSGEGLQKLGFVGSIKEALGSVWKTIVLIWVVMVLRALVGQSFMTFIPVLYAKEGYSLVSIGTMVSLFTVAGAASGLLGGFLSDRVGYKPIFSAAHGLATPSLLLFLFLPGNWVYLTATLAGFFILASLPLGVALAQELAPRGRSMVSSLIMGFALGTGGMLVPLAGKLADVFSIRIVLSGLAVIPLVTVAFIAFLPEARRR